MAIVDVGGILKVKPAKGTNALAAQCFMRSHFAAEIVRRLTTDLVAASHHPSPRRLCCPRCDLAGKPPAAEFLAGRGHGALATIGINDERSRCRQLIAHCFSIVVNCFACRA